MRHKLGPLMQILGDMKSESKGQLMLPFGPTGHYCLMWVMSDEYARPMAVHGIQEVLKEQGKGIVLARPRNAAIVPDDDGDYELSDLEISKVVTMDEIWEAAQANPEMSFEDFMSKKFMEAQMGI